MNTTAKIERQRLRQNIGFADRQVRAVIGTLMLAPAFTVSGELGELSLLLLASVPVLISAIIGWDPLYAAMGKSTYEGSSEDIRQRHWTNANIGIIERGIRLGAGVMLLTLLLGMTSMNAELAFALLAIPLIATAITAWDPLYAAMSSNSFASHLDVEAAEPGLNDDSLARYYVFPQKQKYSREFATAA